MRQETQGGAAGSAPASAPRAKSWPKWKKGCEPPEDVVRAFRLVCQGHDNWSHIARTLGYDPDEGRKKIRRDVTRYSHWLSEAQDSDGIDARSEALTKYKQQERELWKIHDRLGEGENRLRLAVLRQLSEVADKVAAVKEIASRREAHETDAAMTAPPSFNIQIVPREVPLDDGDEGT